MNPKERTEDRILQAPSVVWYIFGNAVLLLIIFVLFSTFLPSPHWQPMPSKVFWGLIFALEIHASLLLATIIVWVRFFLLPLVIISRVMRNHPPGSQEGTAKKDNKATSNTKVIPDTLIGKELGESPQPKTTAKANTDSNNKNNNSIHKPLLSVDSVSRDTILPQEGNMAQVEINGPHRDSQPAPFLFQRLPSGNQSEGLPSLFTPRPVSCSECNRGQGGLQGKVSRWKTDN